MPDVAQQFINWNKHITTKPNSQPLELLCFNRVSYNFYRPVGSYWSNLVLTDFLHTRLIYFVQINNDDDDDNYASIGICVGKVSRLRICQTYFCSMWDWLHLLVFCVGSSNHDAWSRNRRRTNPRVWHVTVYWPRVAHDCKLSVSYTTRCLKKHANFGKL